MVFDFKELKGKKILLLTHENADLDAICSASIFQRVLSSKGINSIVSVPTHINSTALSFCEKEKISINKSPNLSSFDVIFLFDFNDYDQAGSLSESLKKIKKGVYLRSFDHHVIEKTSIDSSKEFVEKAYSTTQIIFRLFNEYFDSKCFFYTALGILEDTGHFTVADKELFDEFSLCLDKSKKEFIDLVSYTKRTFGKDERIALLKAAQRAEIHEVGKALIVTSSVSFYQSHAATKLLEFGADIAIVSGFDEKTNLSIISLRADSLFKEKTKFNLVNDLLKPLQERIGGNFGGHSGAAQWKGQYDHLKVLDECLFILKQKLA